MSSSTRKHHPVLKAAGVVAAVAAMVGAMTFLLHEVPSAKMPANRPSPAVATSPASVPAVKPELSAQSIANLMHVPHFKAFTAATDPNGLLGRHGEYTSKTSWGAGNSVETFATAADALARSQYVSSFRCPIGDGHDYLSGLSLLRVGCSVLPGRSRDMATRFRAATNG